MKIEAMCKEFCGDFLIAILLCNSIEHNLKRLGAYKQQWTGLKRH